MLNARWHATHRLARRATLKQRIAWHVQHAKHCGCRPMPRGIRQAIRTTKAGRDGVFSR